jgi:hypothetical protein
LFVLIHRYVTGQDGVDGLVFLLVLLDVSALYRQDAVWREDVVDVLLEGQGSRGDSHVAVCVRVEIWKRGNRGMKSRD